MNLNQNPTVDQLRELLRHCDDTAGNHVLWVKRTGDVSIARLPNDRPAGSFEQAHPDLQMRYQTFLAGNEYVGPEAADDDEWVRELFDSLVTEWGKVRGRPEVACVNPLR